MAAVATAVAPTMMMGVGKENVARAMAGSYAQMQQKVAAINKESYCAKIDATKADAVASYAQLCTIFKSIKAKYLAASTRLHFLNLLSADEPKQEIAADTNAKLDATRADITAATERQQQQVDAQRQQPARLVVGVAHAGALHVEVPLRAAGVARLFVVERVLDQHEIPALPVLERAAAAGRAAALVHDALELGRRPGDGAASVRRLDEEAGRHADTTAL